MIFVVVVSSLSPRLYRFESNGSFGFITGNGKIAIPNIYSDAREFSEGLAAVKLGSKWGYINTRGKIIIEPRFHQAENFEKRRARIQLEDGGGWGYINRKGRLIWSPTQ